MASKEQSSDLIRAKDLQGLDVWALPSFDPELPEPEPEPLVEVLAEEPPVEIEEVPAEEVTPLTLEELEAIRQDAYNEGFSTGEKDGFHAGQLKAKQEADVALAAKLQRLDEVMKHLLEPIASQDQELEDALIGLLEKMLREVIQRELLTDSTQIRRVLSEALKLLPMGANNIRIHLNPQDLEVVKALREGREENWRLLEDESLLPGGCRVETELSRIDASVQSRIDQVLEQLRDQQVQQRLHPQEADLQVELDTPDAA